MKSVSLTGILIVVFSWISISVTAQHEPCATDRIMEELIKENPEQKEKVEENQRQLEREYAEYLNDKSTSKRSGDPVIVVPVVFHILHENGPENISDAQIHDCMRIVNEDFSASHEHLNDIIPQFESIIGNAQMEFRLARLDPQGNPTDGINRYETWRTDAADDGQQKINGWPRANYLNIWVANTISGSSSNTAAYALLPAGAHQFPTRDGIMANHRYVGSIGTSNPSRQHTITHEIGHFFNLLHPWGSGNSPGQSQNCNTDDGVQDTPNTIGTFGSCNTGQVTCGSLDNVQNLMEYSSCDAMFTSGQVDRMHAAANSGVAQRSTLTSPQNGISTGVTVLHSAGFKVNKKTICARDSVFFQDDSSYDPDSWEWEVEGSIPGESNSPEFSAQFREPGIYNVNLTAGQGNISKSTAAENYIMVARQVGINMPYSENFSDVSQLSSINWLAESNTEGYGFEITHNNGYSSSAGIRVVNFDNPHYENAVYELTSNTLDTRLYTTYNISFRTAYARQVNGQEQDAVRVLISTDCGESWEEVFSTLAPFIESGSVTPGAFVPQSDGDWQMNTINNLGQDYISEKTRIKFEFQSGGNNDLYIDDINISGTWSDQAQLVSPYNGFNGTPSDVTLRWQPLGNTDTYEYQLATDAGFSNVVYSGSKNFISLNPDNEDTEFYAEDLETSQTYYWRVRTTSGGSSGPWSETWSFTVSEDGLSARDIAKDHLGFTLYPNPANDRAGFDLNLTSSETVSWELRNTVGQIVSQNRLSASAGRNYFNPDISHLPSGVYLLHVKVGDQTLTDKLIIR